MGAVEFSQAAQGRTAKEAFSAAVAEAQYDHGHAGYTGTCAEKDEFVQVTVPEGMDPEAFADQLLQEDDERVSCKWGPAGCVLLKKGEGSLPSTYLFFGWASS